MSGGKVWPDRQQLLIGGCRVSVFATVAEHPGAQIGDVFCLRLQLEGAAGALDREIAAALMIQRLAQPTVDPGSFVVGLIRTLEKNAACLEVANGSYPGRRLTNFTNVTQLKGTLGVAASRDHSAAVGGGRRPTGAALWIGAPGNLCLRGTVAACLV